MKQDTRPNILWLCTDQQRFDTLGCYGNMFVRTPNIDRLAASGVRFENAYAQNPVCTPSRASFLTGRYPHVCRTCQNGVDIPEDETLVTRLLHDAGYVCGLSGKLHISACHYSVCKITERRINDGYDYFEWSHGHGPQHDWPLHAYAMWLKAQGVEYAHPPREDCKYVRVGMSPEYHQTKWCADRAIDFMDNANKYGQPWLFSFNCFDPHHAFDPPPEYLERYLPILDEIPLPNYVPGELDDKSPFQRRDHEGAYGKKGAYEYDTMSAHDHRMIRAAYWAMCDFIDVQVGRMLDYLKKSGQLENTIVLFHSDHGENLGDHGMYLKGPYFYENNVHIPLIVSWPKKFRSGVVSPALVELTDLAPTLLEACGLPACKGMQGRSLFSLLSGESSPDVFRDNVYSEFYKYESDAVPYEFCSMIREGKYKLTKIHYVPESLNSRPCAGELYDLEKDPNETHNLYHDPSASDVKLHMLELMCDRIARTCDPLPLRKAPF